MASIGPNNATTFASNSLVGTIAMVSPTNAQLSDDSKSTAVMLLGEVSNYLQASNFSMNIPIHSTVDGIIVEIEKSASLLSAVTDNQVKLVLPSGSLGTTNKASGSSWSNTDGYTTYGSSTDTWSAGLTPIDVNDRNFGVVISATANLLAATASIDHVRVTVHYTQLAMPHNMQRVIRVGNGTSRSERAN